MQSFCAVALGSKLANAALPASVSGHVRVAAANALNSFYGGNHVPASVAAVSFFAEYTLREAINNG
jgi:hypothetical protein